MTPQEKMQAIYNTGMPDRLASKIVGYSKSHYMRMRQGKKMVSGNTMAPHPDAAKKIDELYEQRKDMPYRKVLNGWQKQNRRLLCGE